MIDEIVHQEARKRTAPVMTSDEPLASEVSSDPIIAQVIDEVVRQEAWKKTAPVLASDEPLASEVSSDPIMDETMRRIRSRFEELYSVRTSPGSEPVIPVERSLDRPSAAETAPLESEGQSAMRAESIVAAIASPVEGLPEPEKKPPQVANSEGSGIPSLEEDPLADEELFVYLNQVLAQEPKF